jgi:hypothetical protein
MEQLDQAQEATQEVAQEAQAPISLTLQDLRVVAGAIELGAQRGAFRAPEMEIIGTTYNKLALFLKVNTPAEAPAEATADTTAEVTAE